MKKTDKLHELIRSMSMSEKRYFKVFASRHTIGEKNNYTTLFDILEEMDAYDADGLTASLRRQGVSFKHISSDKNYLYHLILRSLSVFHSGKTASLEIKELLHQVELLFMRGLQDHCGPILFKAHRKAEQYDLYPLLLEIAGWERKILRHEGKLEAVKDSLNKSMNHMALLDNLNAYMKLYYQISELRAGKDRARTVEDRSVFDDFIAHPFLEDETIALSHLARIFFWRSHRIYYYVADLPEAELRANEKLLGLMEEDPDYAEEYPEEYISVYNRMLDLRVNGPDTGFYEILKYFREFPSRLKRSRRTIEARVSILSYQAEMRHLLQKREYVAARALIPAVEEILHRCRRHMTDDQIVTYLYLTAYALLGNEQFAQALPYVNEILNERFEQVRVELLAFTRILSLVIHYELGNYSLLRYHAEAALRFLKKNDHLYEVERSLLKMFSQLGKKASFSARLSLMRQCQEDLQRLLHHDFEGKAFRYFDAIAWLDQKITRLAKEERLS
jgi:hypothetical protein